MTTHVDTAHREVVLVEEGSPVELGTPGVILDVELPNRGAAASLVPPGFKRLRVHAGRRGQLRREPTPGEPLADCGSRTGWRARRGGSTAGDAVHPHGREAVRRDACLQRTVHGLMRPLARRRRRLSRTK